MTRLGAGLLFAGIIAAAGTGQERAVAAEPPAASLVGWWQADVPFLPMLARATPPPYKLDAAAKAAAAIARAGVADYCAPLKFAGYNFGVGEAFEIRTTSEEVSLVTHDVRLERRIALGGRAAAPSDAGSGRATGAWKSGVLEVTTVDLDPEAVFPLPAPGGPGIGPGAVVVERFFLQGPDTLVIEVETTAPAILEKPDRRRLTYSRKPAVDNAGWVFCAKEDRSVDRATGQQRFDMTPPPDLPPPPP